MEPVSPPRFLTRLIARWRICSHFSDECGDPGIRKMYLDGPSALFAYTLVLFPTDEAANACELALRTWRREQRWAERSELKFATLGSKRLEVLEMIASFPCRYAVGVIDKRALRGNQWNEKLALFRQAAGLAVGLLDDYLLSATGYVDTVGSKSDDQKLCKHIGQTAGEFEGEKKFLDLRGVDSKLNDLVQVADVIGGAVFRSLRGDGEDSAEGRFRRVIRRREVGLAHFPPPQVG